MAKASTIVIEQLPESLRAPTSLRLERLLELEGEVPLAQLPKLIRVIACSEFAAKVLQRQWSWFVANVDSFGAAPDAEDLESFVREIASSELDPDAVKAELRRYRQRFLLRVLWREVHALANLDETLSQLSLLADRLLDAATKYAERQLEPRLGVCRSKGGARIPLVIIGMGKLGGNELNFSSDIDIIFCYPEDGETDGSRSLSAHEYFSRLSRQIIALIDEVTADGFVFRIDTRLRPFGDSGPHVVSFPALESYLLKHGRDWERYAYVKARVVGAQPTEHILADLESNMIRPFVYRRYLDFGVFESVREMQSMIAAEVRRRELANNVKLGPGGIREAEFVVQALQLVRGGSEPHLQSRQLQKVLPLLANERGISEQGAARLRDAYRYLRRIENFIQAMRDEQTHDLPGSEVDRARLCLAMQCPDWSTLIKTLGEHRSAISEQFNTVAFRGERDGSAASVDAAVSLKLGPLWDASAGVETWEATLEAGDIREAKTLAPILAGFSSSATRQKADTVARTRLLRFLPRLIQAVVASERPAIALTRTLAIVERIVRRSAYLALLNENLPALSRLVDLCARSQYIADQIAQYPVLLDELLDPRSFGKGITKADIANELEQRVNDSDADDSEAKMQLIAQFQRATMFRIAIADFSGALPIMKVSDGLTWLAEVVLANALQAAWDDLIERHGKPRYVHDGVAAEAGFGIVAYGKLGGLELSYGSDLDIVFLHDSKGESQVTDGDKTLDNAVFFSRLVRRLVHFLTTQTSSGQLYEIDTRLRPDGKSGLLVTSIEAFERYQEENAWTWEHQALLRARAVAGSDTIAREFERIRTETLALRVHRDDLRRDVIDMRLKMRSSLNRSDNETFDLKQGNGGIGDIEFLVQYLVLREAQANPEVMVYSDNIRQLDALVAANIVDQPTGDRLQDIYRDYRLYVHRRVLDGRKALSGADRFGDERAFVADAWDRWLA